MVGKGGIRHFIHPISWLTRGVQAIVGWVGGLDLLARAFLRAGFFNPVYRSPKKLYEHKFFLASCLASHEVDTISKETEPNTTISKN